MHRSAFIPALLLTALLAPGPLLAQEPRCKLSDTVSTCLDRYLTWENGQELINQPTGVDTGGANLATTTKDMLPRLALSGVVGQGSSGQSSGTTVFDFNFRIPGLFGPQGANNAQLQGSVNPQPQLSDAIRNQLPEAQRDDLAGKLKSRIGSRGDAAVLFTYSPATRSLGRSFAQYEDWYKKLCNAAGVTAGWMDSKELPENIKKTQTFKDLPAAEAFATRRKTEEAARSLVDAAQAKLADSGLKDYYKLVSNQPQLHVTAERKFRDPLVGPDELSVKVTYEGSFMNLSAVMDQCGQDMQECLPKYTQWMKDNEPAIEQSNRFSFSGEYSDIRGETVDPGFGIAPIVLKPVRKLILSAGWSRDLKLGDGEPVKADLEGKYENFSDDPNRQDRGVVSLTFTRMIGKMQAAVGIVYANHSEFLSDVAARLSAHIGLRIGMFNGTGSNP